MPSTRRWSSAASATPRPRPTRPTTPTANWPGQIALLKDQIKRQERQREELQSLLQAAAAANDEANGAHYAEELATLESDLNDNKSQADSLEQLYKQNT